MPKSSQGWLPSKHVFVDAMKLTFIHWKTVLTAIILLFVLGLSFQYLLSYISNSGDTSLTLGQLTSIRNIFYGTILLYQFSVLILVIRLLADKSVSPMKLMASGKFWKQSVFALILWLLTVVFIGFASLLFVIPGVYLSVWLSLAIYVLVMEDVNIFDAFKKGMMLTKGYAWQIFERLLFLLFLSVVIAFISIVPVTGYVVASLLTLVLSYTLIFYMGLTYQEVVRLKSSGVKSQPITTGKKVMLVFVAIILFSSLALFSSVSDFVGEVIATGEVTVEVAGQ